MATIKFNLCKDKGEPLDDSDLSEVLADGKFEGKAFVSIDELAKYLISR